MVERLAAMTRALETHAEVAHSCVRSWSECVASDTIPTESVRSRFAFEVRTTETQNVYEGRPRPMASQNILLLPGDGIGPEVCEATGR
jgi:hypothetical protein